MYVAAISRSALARHAPLSTNSRDGASSGQSILSRDADEVFLANDGDTWYGLSGCCVEPQQLSALDWGTKHFAR
ncbi:MAG: hypothetical protein M3P51_15635 [Chloroflexota bacterium]|nr:hypothetical protein [Chloroflexota bacterium]